MTRMWCAQLVEELLPTVKEAPVLGGHNRMPHSATVSISNALKIAPARVPSKPRGHRLGNDRSGSFSGGAFQPLRYLPATICHLPGFSSAFQRLTLCFQAFTEVCHVTDNFKCRVLN